MKKNNLVTNQSFIEYSFSNVFFVSCYGKNVDIIYIMTSSGADCTVNLYEPLTDSNTQLLAKVGSGCNDLTYRNGFIYALMYAQSSSQISLYIFN